MTAEPVAATPATPNRPVGGATHAPITRLLRSELTVVFRRPRTWIALALLGLVPVVIAIGIRVSNGPRGENGGNIISTLVGNGLVLPVAALAITLTVLLPLVGAMWSADALAGETSNGTLRGLLTAPVGRVRLLVVKSFGIAVAVLTACVLIAAVGMITGLVLIGSHGMLTLSGSTLGFGGALGRVAIATGWVAVQVCAVCAVALAVSACTEHPMVVMAATLAGAIVFGVLSSIPSLDWLQPYLLTNTWTLLTDVLRDPMPTDGLVHGMELAGCYAMIGWSLALARVVTKDG
ncbi:MAG TPA: ABC transporter permease subunit [Pseudonocardiaceae bacterium]|nr:ABC transporter permease subunit [Pseudonocardiaceae bacterium]